MECKDFGSFFSYWNTTTNQSSGFTDVIPNLGSLAGIKINNKNTYCNRYVYNIMYLHILRDIIMVTICIYTCIHYIMFIQLSPQGKSNK